MVRRPVATYEFGPFRLSPVEWRLTRGERRIELSPKAFAVLLLMVERAGTLVLKEEILDAVWKGTFVEEANVAVYIAAIRRVLDAPPGANYIETVTKRGYRFVAPVTKRETGSVEPAPVVLVAPVRSRRRWLGRGAPFLIAAVLVSSLAISGGGTPVRVVVVMPFHAASSADHQEYLESGIAEAVAVRLGRISTLRVPPVATVRSGEDAFQAARRLGAEAVVTGSIRESAGHLEVSAQLFRARDASPIWSSTFDAAREQLLDIQNDIAVRIAARLGAGLTAVNRVRPAHGETTSGLAYDFFLQGREQWKRRTPESVQRAIALYQQATQLDPNFAPAYAGLANCYDITNSGLPAEVRYPLAKLNAEKAIALDPDSAEGHTALAFMRYKLEWRWRDADTEFKRAVGLDPQYELAHHWYGEFLRLMGKTEAGIAELRAAVALDPESLATRTDLIAALVQGNHLSEARAEIDEGSRIDPSWSGFPAWMSEIFRREGRELESVQNLWRAMSLRGYPLADVNALRDAYAAGGMKAMLRAQAKQYLRQGNEPASAKVELATVLSFTYAQLDDRDEAFRWLDIAIAHHQDAAIHLLTNPAYDNLRRDPRFDRLLERLGLKNF